MPNTTATNRRFSLTTIAGLTAIAAWCIRNCFHGGEGSHVYYNFDRTPEHFLLPMRNVIEWSVIAIEAVLGSMILWRARSPRATSLGLALLFGLLAVVVRQLAHERPRYDGTHLGFLLFAAGWLTLAALVGWLAGWLTAYASDRRQRSGEPQEPTPAIVVPKKPFSAR